MIFSHWGQAHEGHVAIYWGKLELQYAINSDEQVTIIITVGINRNNSCRSIAIIITISKGSVLMSRSTGFPIGKGRGDGSNSFFFPFFSLLVGVFWCNGGGGGGNKRPPTI